MLFIRLSRVYIFNPNFLLQIVNKILGENRLMTRQSYQGKKTRLKFLKHFKRIHHVKLTKEKKTAVLFKNETLAQTFSSEFCDIVKNAFRECFWAANIKNLICSVRVIYQNKIKHSFNNYLQINILLAGYNGEIWFWQYFQFNLC